MALEERNLTNESVAHYFQEITYTQFCRIYKIDLVHLIDENVHYSTKNWTQKYIVAKNKTHNDTKIQLACVRLGKECFYSGDWDRRQFGRRYG